MVSRPISRHRHHPSQGRPVYNELNFIFFSLILVLQFDIFVCLCGVGPPGPPGPSGERQKENIRMGLIQIKIILNLATQQL